ncbi:hypothetical protein OS493_021152 [Desmophyllum pertusum]|uniref:Uncharacterized protein n=1 Tax=Desmophyllum pertusum TaxID=174260 RepID=A0A9X0D3N6_9CNID|nr:hypothetical protein OS493_021152 [Desmophyllum pertusum]
MAAAAKVIGAVRLGLVDIRVVIEELNTEEMQRDPQILMELNEVLMYNNMPSHNSKFASEKAKPRSMNPVLVAVLPQTQMKYFEVETKTWKPLPYMTQVVEETQSCFCAEYAGNYLYIAARKQSGEFPIYRYDTVNNSWKILPPFSGSNHQINCLCSVNDYIYAISESNQPLQRYSVANNNWQSAANLSFFNTSDGQDMLSTVSAVVLKSKICVIHGYEREEREYRSNDAKWVVKAGVVHFFDPVKNEWEQKASTCHPHFGSSLFVVNSRLCVAGGDISYDDDFGVSYGNWPVEVYDEKNNTWSVVEQKHIPSNKLGAVEIEGRVYFIINKFPIDSGIRIPPEEQYHVSLNEWENLSDVSPEAVLCYLPVKRENLKTENGESQTD